MFCSINDLEGFLGATDGPLGHVKDFDFDDQDWVVRYAIVALQASENANLLS